MNRLFLKLFVMANDLIYGEKGQDLTEYALVLTLVALAATTGVNAVASAINTVFTNISNTLS